MTSNTRDDLIAGAFAGAISRLISAPFDVLKIRFQLQFDKNVKYTSMLQGFRSMIVEEGFQSLWKGNLSATYLWVTYAMVQFGVYGILKRWGDDLEPPFRGNLSQSSKIQHSGENKAWKAVVMFLAGAGAGISATAATYPFDIMRTQFAVQGSTKAHSSIASFVSTTFQTKGIKGFYAGVTPALIGITPYMGLNFAIYESLKGITATVTEDKRMVDFFGVESKTFSTIRKGICGGLAGGASKLLVYPLDTVKKRMQMQVLTSTIQGLGSVPQYSSISHCITKTVTEEGIRGLYKGLGPTVAKSMVATAVTFAAFEGAKDILKLRSQAHLLRGDNDINDQGENGKPKPTV